MEWAALQGRLIIDINITPNRFSRLTEHYPTSSMASRQPSSIALPWIVKRIKRHISDQNHTITRISL